MLSLQQQNNSTLALVAALELQQQQLSTMNNQVLMGLCQKAQHIPEIGGSPQPTEAQFNFSNEAHAQHLQAAAITQALQQQNISSNLLENIVAQRKFFNFS